MENGNEKKIQFLRRDAQPPPSNFKTQGNKKAFIFMSVVLAGFIALFAWTNRDLMYPAVKVETVQASISKALPGDFIAVFDAQPLFVASGWIEPEPYMTKAAAFVEGIVSDVKVIDGQVVKRGDILAQIDDKSLRLHIAELESDLKAMERELDTQGEREKVASKEIALAKEKTAEAAAELARLSRISEILQKSGEAVPLLERDSAKLAVERQSKACRVLAVEEQLRENSLAVIKAEKETMRQRFEAKKANVQRYRLDLERTVIRAPIEGIVQKVYVRVGQKLMLSSDNMDSATVADLYDPSRMQVRVDVALADAGNLEIGMPAMIITEILPGFKNHGVVTSIAGQADIAKNTLQAKVRISEPNMKFRPEMLARVEFMPAPKKNPDGENMGEKEKISSKTKIFVPEKALHNISGMSADVWIAKRHGNSYRAEMIKVLLGQTRKDSWREVKDGIMPNEKIIVSDVGRLVQGRRVSAENEM